MRQDINYSEYIERYLQGEMGPDEKLWFEKEIEGDIKIQDEIKLRKQINFVLSDRDLIDLKSQLEQIHLEIDEVTEKGRLAIRKIYRRVYYTTGALFMLAIGLTLYIYNRDFTNSKILDEYYQPASASANFRSSGSFQDQLTKAMDLYKEKEFKQAIALFEKILAQDSTKIGINLYSGISHMEVKEYNKANEKFQRILQNQPNPFVESAKWYLGMCYIMTNKRDKAAEQFETLAYTNGFYQRDARRILRRIK
jgi:tetratricopeptide (TPR) repeat protein